jgi:hypothetical protein
MLNFSDRAAYGLVPASRAPSSLGRWNYVREKGSGIAEWDKFARAMLCQRDDKFDWSPNGYSPDGR